MKFAIQLIIFFLLTIGVVILLDRSGILAGADINTEQRRRRDRLVGKGHNRASFFIRDIAEKLQERGISKTKFAAMMLASFGIGLLIGKILYVDSMLTVAAAFVVSLSPFVYLEIAGQRKLNEVNEKLESSMRTITNEYMVNPDLISAVRNNIDIIEYQKPFRQFLIDVTYIDASVERALRRMEMEVDNYYFSQWINVLIQSQRDHNTVAMANVQIMQMNTIRRKQIQADAQMYANWRNFFAILIVVLCCPLFIRIFFSSGFTMLITSKVGKGLILYLFAAAIFSVYKALKVNRPILV